MSGNDGLCNLDSNNRLFVIFAAAIAGLGGLLFGFDTGIIADVQGQLTSQYGLTTLQWSMIVSITVLGAFAGALSAGRVTDILGRRKILLIIATGFVIGALILTCSVGFYSLLFGRLLLGICIGIASFTAPLFISEISPKKIRGSLVLLNGIAITGGEALSFLVGYFLHSYDPHGWRLIFATALIPALLLLIGMLFMPRSPRWLVEQNNIEEAKKVLNKIRLKGEAASELKEIQEVVALEKTKNKAIKFTMLFAKKLRPVIFIGIVLGVGQQFAGINTIMYYGPHIFKVAGFGSEALAIFATFILGLVNLIGTIITVLIVDKIGRRKLLVGGTFMSFITLFAVGLCFQYDALPKSLLLMAMILYIFSYAISLGSLFWLIISEIYPTNIRGLAMSFVTAIQWLANFVVAMSFLPLLNAVGGVSVFWIFSGCCLLVCIYSYFFVPETKGVSLEKIEENINAGRHVKLLGEA